MGAVSAPKGYITQTDTHTQERIFMFRLGGLILTTHLKQGEVGLFPFRVEWVFSASKRDTQAVTKLMGDAKVELGDGVTISQT